MLLSPFQIAGAGQGLEYLHSRDIIHGNSESLRTPLSNAY